MVIFVLPKDGDISRHRQILLALAVAGPELLEEVVAIGWRAPAVGGVGDSGHILRHARTYLRDNTATPIDKTISPMTHHANNYPNCGHGIIFGASLPKEIPEEKYKGWCSCAPFPEHFRHRPPRFADDHSRRLGQQRRVGREIDAARST